MVLGLVLPGGASAFGPLSSFGSFGGGPGQLNSPAQIEVADSGDLYVADSGNDRIAVFFGDGGFLRAFGEGVVQQPKDIALDGSGRAFVADSGNNRIGVFSTAGTFFFAFGDGMVGNPSGVAVDGSTVFVADSVNKRIALFTAAGALIEEIPLTSAPSDVIVGPDGNLYIADHDNGKVDVFTKTGEFVGSFGDVAPGDLAGPVSLASDGVAEIYVADQTAQRVEHFGADGSYLGGFAAEHDVAGVGIACQGNVFVVEEGALFARIERFGEPGTPPPPCPNAPQAMPIAPVAKPPSNRFRFAGLVRNRRNGSAVLFVRVPGPGKVFLWGRGVRRLKRNARRAKRVRLPVKPKIPLKRFLKRHGKARIRVNVTFEPTGGAPRTLEKVVVLKRKKHRRHG